MTPAAGSPQPPPSAPRRAAVLAAMAAAAVAAVLPARTAPPGRPGAAKDPPLAVQRRICFPPAGRKPVRTFTGRGAILWTDAPIDGKAVIGLLDAAEGFLRAALPASPPASAPASRPRPGRVAVAVYARRGDYLRLWRRVGAYYSGTFGAIATEGYSYRVFCATSYDSPEAFRRRRAVICHEFAHVWLYRNRGLRNDGNWLTEGIATAVQMRLFPQSADRRQFARWLRAGRMLPLKRMMDLDRIATKDYWQAGTLAELLMRRYGGKLPAVIEAYNRGVSAYGIVSEVLKTDLPSLERQWGDYVRRASAAVKRRPTTSAAATQPR